MVEILTQLSQMSPDKPVCPHRKNGKCTHMALSGTIFTAWGKDCDPKNQEERELYGQDGILREYSVIPGTADFLRVRDSTCPDVSAFALVNRKI